jgi:putative addiction module killer protein
MIKALRTEAFATWMGKLRDSRAVAKITARIDRLCLGNPGDVKPIGQGLSELRIDYGPGYRVYYGEHFSVTIILLLGGTKGTQSDDIKEAKRLFLEWKEHQK